MKKVIYLITLLIPLSVFSQKNLDFEKLADSIFTEFNNDYTPGFAIGVIKDGEVIFSKGYGIASLNYKTPITTETIFPIASMTKQFTASCIAILVLQSKISLDDDIRKYLPDFPFLGDTIRVRHLVYHMSGLNDYPESIIMSGDDLQSNYSYAEVLDLVYSQKKLLFTPGDRFQYNNSNYVLLAKIIESVSGENLNTFANKRIFEPLDMKNTKFIDNTSIPIFNKAVGYTKTADGKYFEFDINTPCIGSGNIVTTLKDMLLWENNFHDNQIFPKGYIELVTEKQKFNNGEESLYTFGVEHDNYNGMQTLYHGGSVNAYKSINVRFPEHNISVVVLANSFYLCDWLENEELAHKVASFFISTDNHKEGIDIKPLNFSKYPEDKISTDFSGKYIRNDKIVWIYKKRDKYYMTFKNSSNYWPLLPINDSLCVDEEAMGDFYSFRIDNVSSISCDCIGGEFKKVENIFPDEQRKKFTGIFYCEELNTVYNIYSKGNKLFCKINSNMAVELVNVGSDSIKLENMLIEVIPKGNRIEKIKVTGEMDGNMEFIRIVK